MGRKQALTAVANGVKCVCSNLLSEIVMSDQSHLDHLYFIDQYVYNCPFCNRRNVEYWIEDPCQFDWTNTKRCYVYFTECSSCHKKAIHLSFAYLNYNYLHKHGGTDRFRFADIEDIDSRMFYSAPTSFFVLNEAIPRVLRELITEAEGCLKMNFLTGASACTRKVIYELLILEKADGRDYDARIKALKQKHPELDPAYVDVLSHIQDMTSDKVHEQSWDEWDSPHLQLLIGTLKTVLHEIYVLPKERQQRFVQVSQLLEVVKADKTAPPTAEAGPTETAEHQGGT